MSNGNRVPLDHGKEEPRVQVSSAGATYGTWLVDGTGVQGAVTAVQEVPSRTSSIVCRRQLLMCSSRQSKTRLLLTGGQSTGQAAGSSRSTGSSGPYVRKRTWSG